MSSESSSAFLCIVSGYLWQNAPVLSFSKNLVASLRILGTPTKQNHYRVTMKSSPERGTIFFAHRPWCPDVLMSWCSYCGSAFNLKILCCSEQLFSLYCTNAYVVYNQTGSERLYWSYILLAAVYIRLYITIWLLSWSWCGVSRNFSYVTRSVPEGRSLAACICSPPIGSRVNVKLTFECPTNFHSVQRWVWLLGSPYCCGGIGWATLRVLQQ